MVDFLRSNTWCSREEYLWQLTVPQVRLSCLDFTHIDYDRRRAKRERKGKTGKKTKHSMSIADMLNKNMTDNGTPIISI